MASFQLLYAVVAGAEWHRHQARSKHCQRASLEPGITAARATEAHLLLRSELQACLAVQEAAWRLASAERGTTESLTPLAEQMGDVEMVQVCHTCKT